MKGDLHLTYLPTKKHLQTIAEAIEVAGYKAGEEVQLAMDVAASEILRRRKIPS